MSSVGPRTSCTTAPPTTDALLTWHTSALGPQCKLVRHGTHSHPPYFRALHWYVSLSRLAYSINPFFLTGTSLFCYELCTSQRQRLPPTRISLPPLTSAAHSTHSVCRVRVFDTQVVAAAASISQEHGSFAADTAHIRIREGRILCRWARRRDLERRGGVLRYYQVRIFRFPSFFPAPPPKLLPSTMVLPFRSYFRVTLTPVLF